ncbi:MAG: helix-turn-helix transcriptional regulator [Chitinophagales bacterium]|nr:helix-turn-helix transcriptional regulator [Hyphomicrobiales bacterium]
MMIIWRLLEGPKRYVDLRESVEGLSERVLTQALAELSENGAVMRQGPKWRLTEAGEALRPALYELFAWGERMEMRASELASAG